MKTSTLNWYEASTGNHQGLVVEEKTGRNIAVAYDKADAPLIAAAPELLAALHHAEEFLTDSDMNAAAGAKLVQVIRAALARVNQNMR